ncbi:hypothetical protein [Natronobacterium texcoconense]|uniref:Uncharacterized protein n=1 Tax=Natronobacterium texcoconense TaxID=1095778 RepID=A0A1H1I3B7_NATTX|nr:hypothetical protein [Natronobacterium texcoconense]SDR32079.1 hypothetical protein SAMN04489842_3277 [Natronobacterium texcoconense]
MREHQPLPRRGIDNRPPSATATLGSGFAFVAIIVALLWAVSYPTLAVTVLAVVGASALALRTGGRALARRFHGRITELSIPGVATIRISVSPN